MKGKAGFVDSFCDKGAFSPESTAEFFRSAKEMGFQLRMHADELAVIGRNVATVFPDASFLIPWSPV